MNVLKLACEKNDPEMINNLFLHYNETINIIEAYEYIFSHGSTELLNTLILKKNFLDDPSEDEYKKSVISACIYNNKTVVSLLESFDIMDYFKEKEFLEDCLIASIQKDNVEVFEYLIDKFNIELTPQYFILSCQKGALSISVWIYKKIDNFDIEYDDHAAMKTCCKYNQITIAGWLTTICDKYKLSIHDEKIIDCKLRKK